MKLQRVWFVMLPALAMGFAGCSGFGTGAGNGNYYLHWTCASSSQCASVMGGFTGIWHESPYASSDLCIQKGNFFASNNIIQWKQGPIGDWCDLSSDPNEPNASSPYWNPFPH